MTQLFNKFYIPEDVGISSVAIAQFLKECDEINYKLRKFPNIRFVHLIKDWYIP